MARVGGAIARDVERDRDVGAEELQQRAVGGGARVRRDRRGGERLQHRLDARDLVQVADGDEIGGAGARAPLGGEVDGDGGEQHQRRGVEQSERQAEEPLRDRGHDGDEDERDRRATDAGPVGPSDARGGAARRGERHREEHGQAGDEGRAGDGHTASIRV